MASKLILCSMFMVALTSYGQTEDVFDRVTDTIDRVKNKDDCMNNTKSDLLLPRYSVTNLPTFRNIKSNIWYENRTALLQIHNMAFNRAIFYSYIMQKLNSTYEFFLQPDWTYMSISTIADIYGNEGIINASAILYDNNCHYPNWYRVVEFNATFPLYGPKAHHIDTRTGFVKDMGSGGNHNYTTSSYKMNPWYDIYLPDKTLTFNSVNDKVVYSVRIKYSSQTGVFTTSDFVTYSFYGPALSGDKPPVTFTQPYFDCESSEKWVVSAVSPIVDYLARYSRSIYLRRPRFVGAVVMDIDFMNIDINSCDPSIGNPQPSTFAGIDNCVKSSTTCQPIPGRGFKRGGYTCKCKDGYHYPVDVQGPFKGTDVDGASPSERENNFQCLESYNTSDIHEDHNNQTSNIQKRSIFVDSSRKRRDTHFDQSRYDKMQQIFNKVKSVNRDTCAGFQQSDLLLPIEYTYGVHEKFDNQARMALRLSHFLSNYLQNVVPNEVFGSFNAGQNIHFDNIFGEVIANVISDNDILSSGLFYEPNSFVNRDNSTREYFGPYAYSRDNDYYALDTAGYQTRYTDENWYSTISSRWRNNTSGLLKFKMDSFIRSDKAGTNTIKHPHSPMEYYAPSVNHGHWSQPRFKCDGQVDDWVMTYSVPFIGLDDGRNNLKFRGVVTVDVPLNKLDGNQCPEPSDVTNPFRNTALCDLESTDCIPVAGRMFQSGGYKCNCKIGFEYPWNNGSNGYDGKLMEQEYLNLSGNSTNDYDKLKSRKIEEPEPIQPPVTTPIKPISSASADTSTPLLIVSITFVLKSVQKILNF